MVRIGGAVTTTGFRTPSLGLRLSKELDPDGVHLVSKWERALRRLERRMHSTDAQEGPRAFVEKRPPRWTCG